MSAKLTMIPLVVLMAWPAGLLEATAAQPWSPPPKAPPGTGATGQESVNALHASPPQQQQRRRGGRGRQGMYRDQVTPHWFADSTRFWYRNDLRDGAREFIVVDAERGTRRPAFDHQSVAQQIGEGPEPNRLPVEALEFDQDGRRITLIGDSQRWRLNVENGKLETLPGEAMETETEGLPATARPRPSTRTGPETQIIFDNRLDREVEIFWLDDQGERQSYGSVPAGDRREQHTYGGHVWLVADQQGNTLGVYEATDEGGTAIIDGSRAEAAERRARRFRGGPRPSSRPTSPDGQWTAFVQDNNVFVRSSTDDSEPIQLSQDGEAGDAYGQLEWSPDSKHLVAWRTERPERKEVYLIRSSPRDGGRAEFESRPYALPGDAFPKYELNLFDIEHRKHIKPSVDRFEHEWLRPDLHWWPGNTHFAYTQDDRGHQRYRVIDVSVADGEVRNLIDEKSDTFIWTTHMEGPERLGLRIVTYLDDSREIVYASERDGWRHLYLIDARTGQVKNQITRGEWVVRGIDRIDEEQRQIWFKASGMAPDQDPYFIHFYRINFDGTGLVALTEGNGNHTIDYSPDRRYFIDTYSRVDAPPINELRRAADGKLVCRLEEADIEELKEQGFEPPEVFVAKGRDGVTEIWGLLFRPRDFDPEKQYPIIEDVYAGPQDSFVPKSFSTRSRYQALTDLGFIVVKIDGMGTANRSKAFHDVCFRNLKDGGFEDRILWMKAAAKEYPSMDLTRVGVYGNSAGGQNAAAAVLFHPDFYKAAVASCGCHDNRLDKASWNEQWMGYLAPDKIWEKSPDNWYSQCSNIDNAARLEGKLFLIVGEMDKNVPPESTMRLVDALIRADKDFDLLVIPNGGHGMGGSYGQRRMQDFFVRHLQGIEIPNRNVVEAESPAGS